jgi:hypothetical protein
MTNETVDKYSSEMEDQVSKRLSRTMAAVPSGLPVLPPHWVFTINVWTYEMMGEYEAFIVTDNDNEAIPKPYFGHKGQKYVRQDETVVYNDKYVGENAPIIFKFSGYATTIVGPGPKGVGDKVGKSTEESIGYGDLLSRSGGNK